MTSDSPSKNDKVGLSIQDAQEIVRKHFTDEKTVVSNLREIDHYGYSFSQTSKIYVVDLQSEDNTKSSCFITVAQDPTTSTSKYQTNALQVIHNLLETIRSKTAIPISDSVLDTSREIIPYDYLLSPPSPFASSDIISLREAKRRNVLDPKHQVLIDLTLGQFLAQLHTNVQNDWFGVPALKEPGEPSYSWQETFTLLFESFMENVKHKGGYEGLPYDDIQLYMSRAIAFFLFDDVEVPSLIWLTGSEDDIYISLPTHPSTKIPSIAALLPSLTHAVWGDPLLETMFMDLNNSKTILEGYTASGGGPLISFPRQKTKRLWYTIFLAFVVISESNEPLTLEQQQKRDWAKETIVRSVTLLRDSPCY
ncbi:hypothetical protein CC1G_13079 [Coprinopsis cinerea okayama7|uniref:Aminoglycoside phosphotransferase domain-containing protein n=1 Tax=Coprinopsis cinerea (strain Okayama-7 / 130 / ATCC MYA-4618 / FGSC 9003) TaxID=240176 RepID=A8NMD5_COPC7|nr:hypothetical protein CC1G_13079 [Coprinopsis cinerea okayama7\|eukprot:XP_001834895.1 hypothetical protein CC1G_13079 [Coprinopsis cinerea okayama7\